MFCWSKKKQIDAIFSDEAAPPAYTSSTDPACGHKGEAASPFRLQRATDTTEQLAALRGLLEENKVDYYLIPSGDAHGSEYVAEKDKRQRYISGFTGESSTALVSRHDALLFVDGRYHLQAEKEIDSNWTLERVGLKDVPTWTEYLETIPQGSRVGLDATLFEIATFEQLRAKVSPKGIDLVCLESNLVDAIWTSRPPASTAPLITYTKYAGQTAASKLEDLRKYLKDHSASAYVVSNLAEIAWLLNLRGSDIPHSPVFESYVLVTLDSVMLYIDQSKITQEVMAYLKESVKAESKPYDGVWRDLAGLKDNKTKTLMSKDTSFAVYRAAGEEFSSTVTSPLELAKSIKNETELAGIRAAYTRDGAAWATWMAWLEEEVRKQRRHGRVTLTEWEAANKLTDLRKSTELFMDLAYENISATAGNAALPHYSAGKNSAAVLDLDTPYLNDSGANYLDGTIDCTRTYHFSKPTREHKRAYTRVLQGHIQLARTTFPEGTSGAALDAIARRPLWMDGYDYLHGTGHGLGAYLNVHEGPQKIASVSGEPLRPGQIVSNEPGIYEAERFGIRIESIYLIKEVSTKRGSGGKWYGFDRITQVPISTIMVDWALLDHAEKEWLREHNRAVVKTLLSHIPSSDKRTRAWLKSQAC